MPALDTTYLEGLFADARALAATDPPASAAATWEALGQVADEVEPALNVRNLRLALSAYSPWNRAQGELVNRGIPTGVAADITTIVQQHDYCILAAAGPNGQTAAEDLADATEPVAQALNDAIDGMTPGVGLWDAATLTIVTP